MVAHPRRTTGELVSDAGQVVGAGIGAAGHIASTVTRAVQTGQSAQATVDDLLREAGPDPRSEPEAVAEELVDRPGPVPEEALEEAATPAPKPAPPKKRRTARKVGEEVKTPSGISAADTGHNAATGEETDLVQPGTEPLMDPSLTKSVAAEAKVMKKAAAVDK